MPNMTAAQFAMAQAINPSFGTGYSNAFNTPAALPQSIPQSTFKAPAGGGLASTVDQSGGGHQGVALK